MTQVLVLLPFIDEETQAQAGVWTQSAPLSSGIYIFACSSPFLCNGHPLLEPPGTCRHLGDEVLEQRPCVQCVLPVQELIVT